MASRIQPPIILVPGTTDYTATVVDLDRAPLTEGEQLELAKQIRAIHRVARGWDAARTVTDAEIAQLVKKIRSRRPYSSTHIREFCIELVSSIEQTYAARQEG